MLLAALSLTQREIVRFWRQPSRVVGALAPPLLFWFLIGSGIGDTYRLDPTAHGRSSLEFLFPGTLLLIMLFTAIFSTISLVEDRREGFLQSVLVAPGARGREPQRFVAAVEPLPVGFDHRTAFRGRDELQVLAPALREDP